MAPHAPQPLYDQLARIGKAVASPHRIQILDLLAQGEKSVEALAEACRRAGVQIVTGHAVSDLATLPVERVVLAAGAWSSGVIAAAGAPSVRPVKGQALRLRDPAGPGLCDHVLRWGPPTPGYLVPRGDGRYYLGATVEEQGFDTSVTALGVYELLREAAEVIPGVLELEIEESFAGLRPGTPDNAPIVGTDPADERIVWATGHYRNGILLTPLTAELVADELTGGRPDHALRPERFAVEATT